MRRGRLDSDDLRTVRPAGWTVEFESLPAPPPPTRGETAPSGPGFPHFRDFTITL